MLVGDLALKASRAVLEAVKHTVGAALNLIADVLNSFELSLTVSGSLDPKQVTFGVKFMLRVAGLHIDFSVRIDFSIIKLSDIAAFVFSRIKDLLLSKIAGLAKLIHL
jgi:hypothetical protein